METSNIKVAFCPEHGLQFFDAQSRTCEHIPREENNMEIIDQIHQKLTTLNLATFESNEVNRLIGRAFRAGLAEQADPLAGYSNLTAAISAGEPIDWERLDGKRVQCVNPELRGEIHGTLKQNGSLEPYLPGTWWDGFSNAAYINALYDGWYGNDGWTLYVEGEIPMRRKTADQLKVGTYFQGVSPNREIFTLYVGEMAACGQVSIHYTPTMIKSPHKASEWVVLEEYGTFQKPEGK